MNTQVWYPRQHLKMPVGYQEGKHLQAFLAYSAGGIGCAVCRCLQNKEGNIQSYLRTSLELEKENNLRRRGRATILLHSYDYLHLFIFAKKIG